MIERHERVCTDRWEQQKVAMDRLRQTTEASYAASSSDRAVMRQQIEDLHAKATSIVTRFVIWLMSSMAAGLAGSIWWIATHKWV